MSLDLILLIVLIISALWTIMSSRMLTAAIGLALTSAVLAIIIFKLSSPLAAVFELTVCSGLITVIFISTIIVVKPLTDEELLARRKERIKKYIYLPFILMIVGFLLSKMSMPTELKLPEVLAETSVYNILWNLREIDLLGQIIILLVGVFGITILFKDDLKK